MRYQSNRPKRQFLAGVKCPSCHQTDVIVQVEIFEPVSDEYIECTDCGHTDRRPTLDELPQIQQKNHEDAIQIVNFKV